MNATRAWSIVVASVTGYELWCLATDNDEQLLSRGIARARASSPAANAAILFGIGATALHLAGIMPKQLDIYVLARS
ncbi:hypothetical protein L5I01_17435 [Gordonia sp. HY442]|uniref:DUF7427 family protein n=1 Tax=Gordonia zhenghanii TaxID=2911516 RepID=UPI001F2C7157|nr:hypothetical protein [Gordonia zhenghanii]MCF8605140.1 hypothetical protein [Gordonia zhenghanii]